MPSDLAVEGPLRIWTWPVLNAIVKISENRNKSIMTSDSQTVETAQIVRNAQGDIDKVVVTRE